MEGSEAHGGPRFTLTGAERQEQHGGDQKRARPFHPATPLLSVFPVFSIQQLPKKRKKKCCRASQLELAGGAFVGRFVVLEFAGGKLHRLQQLPFKEL